MTGRWAERCTVSERRRPRRVERRGSDRYGLCGRQALNVWKGTVLVIVSNAVHIAIVLHSSMYLSVASMDAYHHAVCGPIVERYRYIPLLLRSRTRGIHVCEAATPQTANAPVVLPPSTAALSARTAQACTTTEHTKTGTASLSTAQQPSNTQNAHPLITPSPLPAPQPPHHWPDHTRTGASSPPRPPLRTSPTVC